MVCAKRTLRQRNECEGGSVALSWPIRCVFWTLTAVLHLICPHSRRQIDILAIVETIFSVLQVFFAVVLIFLVLMHSGKDSGLSGAFGVGSGTGPLGGGSLVERNLNRWTIFFAVVFFLNAFLLLKAPWA
jgi:preprotein translocase subunit SecG